MAEVDRRNGKRRGDDKDLEELVVKQRQALRNAGVGYLILLAFSVGGLFILERTDAHRARHVETNACERVNLLREQSNATSEIVFATLWTSAQRERTLSHGTRGATHRRSATVLEFLARRALHTKNTDCRAAAHDPRYKRPQPHGFNPDTDPLVQVIRERFMTP